MLRIITAFLFTTSSFISFAQIELTWDDLADVKYDREWSEDVDSYFWFPEFDEKIKAMEGKEVQITGYLIPFDETNGAYVLSANPFAACFFCGNAGPESVMGLNLSREGVHFNTDEYLTFKGTLRLNAKNIYEMNYILEDAQLVKK